MGDTELGVGDHARTAKERPSQLRIDAPDIPGYRIDAVLGEGGMGTVYGAEQAAPRRRVAIKVLHSRSASALARFTAEADIMARLDHPGIARVLEAGTAGSGAGAHPFLVMEHVDGATLDRHAKTLSRRERIALFVALCTAVHHAHVKGVIHRDLKPSNVMVRPDGRVIVLDFGVARLAAGANDATPGPTRAGELVGTPLYMSPEQARLQPDEVDVRTDVYTLGVMLYELLSNELPYETREAPLPILTCMICEDPPIAVSKRDATLRGDLEAIVMKAIAKEPQHRYQSVAALGDDVRRWLDGLAVSVRMPGALERARRFVRRRPLVAAAIAATLGAIAVFAIVVTWLWLDASRARSAAETASVRTEAARAQLESQTNQLVLRQARATLARDPTEALAWLATLTPRDVDAATAWSIADEALARGVARDVMRGHADEVHWVEPLPGGFVTGGYDGRVIVWDPAQKPIFVAKRGRIHTVRPAPGGGELAIGGDDGALHVVSRSGDVRAELAGHAGDVQHVAWTSDAEWLASSDDHGKLFVWPRGRAPGVKLRDGTAAIGTLAFAADGDMLAAADHDGHVWLWRASTGALVGTAEVGADVQEVWTDGRTIVAVTATGVVHTLRAVGDGLRLERTIDTKLACKRAAIARDGSFAVLGGVGGSVTRVEGVAIVPIAQLAAQVRSLAVSSDGRWIAAGGEDGLLVVHDRTTGQLITLRGHTGRIRHIAFAGGELLSSDSDGVVRRWQLADMPATVLDTGVASERAAIAGDTFAWADAAGDVKTWNFATHRFAHVGHVDGRATAIAVSGSTVITGGADGVVTWWSAAPVRRALHGIVKSIAVRDDVVAIATASGPIALFTSAGEPTGELAGHPGGSDTIALADDIAVSGGQDRVVRVWRLADRAPLAALDGPHGDTHFVAVTATSIVSAGNDGNVYAWPRDKLGPRRTLAHHTGAVTAFALAGDTVVSAGRDATLARAHLGGGRADTTTIPMAAVALAVDDDGTVHAVTRSGAAARWGTSGPATVEIDHGVRDGARIPGTSRWIEAFEDGTFVIVEARPRTLDELRETIAAATTIHVH